MILELAGELGEVDTARNVLRCTSAMKVLKREFPQRYLRLEHLLKKDSVELRDVCFILYDCDFCVYYTHIYVYVLFDFIFIILLYVYVFL